MRSVAISGWAALALLAAGPGTKADMSDLAAGVLLVHAPPGLEYSAAPAEGWCARYLDQHAIAGCEDAVPRIDDGESRLWFVLAAWEEPKTWMRVELGLGLYDPSDYVIDRWGVCGSGVVFATVCDWPAPNCGITIQASTAWSGNYVPLLWFAGTAYAAALVPLAESPFGYAGFQNALDPPEAWPARRLGALGVFRDGVAACPEEALIACCVDLDCVLAPGRQACLDLGGVPRPDEYDCLYAHCSVPPTAVCCLSFSGSCLLVDDYDCHFMGGTWHPAFRDCSTGPCPQTPAGPTTWGQLKRLYQPAP